MRTRKFAPQGMQPICEIFFFPFRRLGAVDIKVTLFRVTLLGIPQNLSHDSVTQTPKTVVLRARKSIFCH